MINVNQITAQLARMPDASLQQYASMHKNDPYTVSLALAESNRRKEMRTASQGQQGGEPPKVVDQGIAEMMAPAPQAQAPAQPMPEDVGIGALPAPNMQGMAEGGIVAFGGGGEVPGFADGVYIGEGGQYSAEPLTAEELAQRDPLAQLRQFSQWAGRNVERDPVTGEVVRKAPAAPSAPAAVTPGVTPTGGIGNLSQPATKVPPPAVDVGSRGGLGDLGGPRAAPTAPRAPMGPTDFAGQIKTARAAMSDADPYAAQTSELGQLGVERAQASKAALESDTAKFGKAYEGREGRLSKREEDIGKQKESNMGLAFLNAGLAIMSTPGGLASAIGKGARVGTEQFAAGLDKIRAAQERLDEARDKMEDLKLNRAEMSAKDIRQANTEIHTAQMDAKKLSIAGARDAGAKNDKMAEKVVELSAKEGLTREEMASRERAAATTASAYAGRLGAAGERLDLDRLKAQQKLLQDQIKETPNYGAGKAKRAELERALLAIQNQMSGGTMPPPPAAAAPGGPKVIDFMTGKPI